MEKHGGNEQSMKDDKKEKRIDQIVVNDNTYVFEPEVIIENPQVDN